MQDNKNLHIAPIDSDEAHVTIDDWEKDVHVESGSILDECSADISATNINSRSQQRNNIADISLGVTEKPSIVTERDRILKKHEERIPSRLRTADREDASSNVSKRDRPGPRVTKDTRQSYEKAKKGASSAGRSSSRNGGKKKFTKWKWIICLLGVIILACGIKSVINHLGNKDNSSLISNSEGTSAESITTSEAIQETESNDLTEEPESQNVPEVNAESESTEVADTGSEDETTPYIWDFSKSIAELSENRIHGNIEIIETNYGVRGALLDGNEDYIECGTGMNLSDSWSFHTAFSCYDVDKKYSAFFAKYETNNYGPYAFSINYGHVNCWFTDESNSHTELESTSLVSNGEWVDVIVTKEKNTVCLYVNGILEGREDINCIQSSSDTVTIGRQALMFEPYDQLQFTGIIADISIYEKVLSYEEIKQLSDKTHEVAQTALENGSNQKATDKKDEQNENSNSIIWNFSKSLSEFGDQSNKFHGNIEMVETDTGIRGALLDGDEDYIECGTGMNLSDSWSFHAAFSCYDVDKKYSAFFAKYETNHNGPYAFSINHGHVNCWFSEDSSNHIELESVSSINNGDWVDVIVTKEKSTVCLYINGVLEGREDINCIQSSNDTVTIGRQALMFEPYDQLQFTGLIADVSIYEKVLSYEEIKKLSDKTLTISSN